MAHISQAEWEVMRVVWTKEETTSKEIVSILQDKQGWSVSTIKTLLARLVEKEHLKTRKVGNRFFYQADLSEKEAIHEEIQQVFDRFCLTKHQAVLYQLIKETPMTLSDIKAMEVLLLAKKGSAVDEVTCNCIKGQCQCLEHLEG
ncbi:CopY/TcrY family copper transport repressor [Streptococcus porcorum]|uniref:CopY/TcrY family copper transport repressor n=1 Tax=Streptococcus porcorum TaxID=701526 RepID=A0ABV2JGC8_9STRE